MDYECKKALKKSLLGVLMVFASPLTLMYGQIYSFALALLVALVLLVFGAGFSISYYSCLRRSNGD